MVVSAVIAGRRAWRGVQAGPGVCGPPSTARQRSASVLHRFSSCGGQVDFGKHRMKTNECGHVRPRLHECLRGVSFRVSCCVRRLGRILPACDLPACGCGRPPCSRPDVRRRPRTGARGEACGGEGGSWQPSNFAVGHDRQLVERRLRAFLRGTIASGKHTDPRTVLRRGIQKVAGGTRAKAHLTEAEAAARGKPQPQVGSA